jgi:hypothetical protein
MHTITNNRRPSRASPSVRTARVGRRRETGPPGDRTDAATSFTDHTDLTRTRRARSARARRACSAAPPPTLSRLELSASSLHSDSLGCGSVRTVSLVSAHVGGTKNSSSFLTGHVLTSAQSTNALLLLRLPSQHTSSRRSSRRSHAGSGHGRCGERHPPTAPSDEGGDGWGGDGRRWRGSVRVGAMVSALRCGGVARPRQRWRSPWRPWSR